MGAKTQADLIAERFNYLVADDYARRKVAEISYAEHPLVLPDIRLNDFIEETDETVPWRIEGLHAVGHNTTLTAEYKSGKSTMMINLLRSLADGASFLDQPVVKPVGNTSYWNLEVSAAQMRDWCRKVRIEHPERVLVQNLRGVRTNLWNDNAVAEVIRHLKTNEVECWILDPGARLLPGWPGSHDPENSNGVIGDLADRLDKIKLEAGVEDLWIPLHTGREAGNRARGAARWDDWADAIWLLKVYMENGVKERRFQAKGRDVEYPEIVLGFDPETNREWCIGTAAEAKQLSDVKTVVHALRNGPLTAVALRDAMAPMKNDRKTEAREEALQRGWIKSWKDGKTQWWALADHADVKQMLEDWAMNNWEKQ